MTDKYCETTFIPVLKRLNGMSIHGTYLFLDLFQEWFTGVVEHSTVSEQTIQTSPEKELHCNYRYDTYKEYHNAFSKLHWIIT